MIIDTWQHFPEHISSIAFYLGPIAVSWYGIMYAVSFATVYFLVRYRIRKKETNISLETVQEFFPWGIIGILLGARLGDVFIYNWTYFKNHPSQIFLPYDIHNHWQYIGIYGMSYFGGFVGLALAFYIFCRRNKINLFELSDLLVPAIPLALAFGRLGNFINGELYGRATAAPWGMYFPQDITGQLRHPSQLYELFLEGIMLFMILRVLRFSPFIKRGPRGILTSFYLIGYGLARFISEFFREPDNGWLFLSLTLGQWFSVLMIVLGLLIIEKTEKKLKNIVY